MCWHLYAGGAGRLSRAASPLNHGFGAPALIQNSWPPQIWEILARAVLNRWVLVPVGGSFLTQVSWPTCCVTPWERKIRKNPPFLGELYHAGKYFCWIVSSNATMLASHRVWFPINSRQLLLVVHLLLCSESRPWEALFLWRCKSLPGFCVRQVFLPAGMGVPAWHGWLAVFLFWKAWISQFPPPSFFATAAEQPSFCNFLNMSSKRQNFWS